MTNQAMTKYEVSSVSLATEIVASYIANNSVPRADLPTLIIDIHAAIERLRTGAPLEVEAKLIPAIAVKRSVTDDYIVCLEDGKRFKSLKRHLSTQYGLTPDEYRAKWGLPSTYPMVAPAYATARSSLAKSMGLGRKRIGADVIHQRVKRKPTIG